MALVYSLMATGGKGDGLSAVMAAQRLAELVLDTIVASKPMAAPPLQLPPGIRFTDCIERILCAIETGGLADWIAHRQGELIVTIDQLATGASMSLTCIEREQDADVAAAWFWRFSPCAEEGSGASQPCPRHARRLIWTLQTLLPLGEALRGVC